MSFPGAASSAIESIDADVVTDQKVETMTEQEAEDLEGARREKDQIEKARTEGKGDDGDEDETDKLERGAFHPHAYPYGNVSWSYNPSRQTSVANGNVTKGHKMEEIRSFGRGGAGRRQSIHGPHIASEASELARAEAASWAQMSPLMAATLGPLSVLMGIPTLTQRWRGRLLDPPLLPNGVSNFEALPDPGLNLALAGVSLFCEVAGNGLLILRFSNFHTKVTTWVSYLFWIAKIVLGMSNYIQFGITYPQTDDIIYLQGFWVGVCGLGVTTIVLIFLTFNLMFLHRQTEEETRRLHNVQREFMLQTTVYFLFIGICALIFSKAEGTSYVDGIYYLVVSMLTIGFGDLTPQTVAMKVLTFPFTIVGITLLALIVTSIVRLLADRARRRKSALKKRLKQKAKDKKRIYGGYGSKLTPWKTKGPTDGYKLKRSLTLQEELRKLREDDWRRERRANLRSMTTGMIVFFIFWFPWGYGNALYFCYIFFLTIGFGDFFPNTEAGRPIFIVYALLAVPTMTIIVETVTTNFTAFTMQRVHHKKNLVYQHKDFEIQSLNSLVKQAKKVTSERLTRTMTGDSIKSIHLPLHDLTERLQESLQRMHHRLQSLLMQKLGPDARNVIAAERARQTRADKEKLQQNAENGERLGGISAPVPVVAQDGGDELELLNEYRENYATILAELMVAKERLLDLEKGLERRTKSESLRTRLSDDIEELSEDDGFDSRRRSGPSSMGISSDGHTSDERYERLVLGRADRARLECN